MNCIKALLLFHDCLDSIVVAWMFHCIHVCGRYMYYIGYNYCIQYAYVCLFRKYYIYCFGFIVLFIVRYWLILSKYLRYISLHGDYLNRFRRSQVATILQTFSNAFSWINIWYDHNKTNHNKTMHILWNIFSLQDKVRVLSYAVEFNYELDGLVQERHNSIANALELRLSCTNQSKWLICFKLPSQWTLHNLALEIIVYMMTSSNGSIFRVTCPLCGEFTGHWWIPLTKASDTELWCFLWSTSEQRVK